MKMSTGVVVGVVVVVLAGASYAGATAYSGQRAQVEMQHQLAKLQTQYPFLKVSDQTYDRGLFRSTSKMTLQVGCASADGTGSPFTATVTNVIHHGPFAAGSMAAAVVDSEFRFGKDTGPSPLTAHTSVGFKGKYHSALQSLPAKVAGPNGADFAWEGLSGEADGDTRLNTVSYHLKSPGLTVTDTVAASSIHVGALELQADTTAINAASSLRVGKMHGSIDKVQIDAMMPGAAGAGTKPGKVTFEKLLFADDMALEGDLIGGSATLSGAGSVNDTRVDHVEMQISIKRLHAPTYEHMMDTLQKASYGCPAPTAGSAAAMLAPMQGDVRAMLQYNPEISMDKLAIDYGGKRGEFAYTLGMRGVSQADSAQTPMNLMMAHGYAKASARLPLLWIQQAASAVAAGTKSASVPTPDMLAVMIDQFAEQGYLVHDGDYIKSSAELNAGQLSVNGKPMGGAPR